MRGLPRQKLPGLEECLERNLEAARLTNPAVRPLGVSINTAALDEAGARECMAEIEQALGLPTVDAFRTGVARLVDAIP